MSPGDSGQRLNSWAWSPRNVYYFHADSARKDDLMLKAQSCKSEIISADSLTLQQTNEVFLTR